MSKRKSPTGEDLFEERALERARKILTTNRNKRSVEYQTAKDMVDNYERKRLEEAEDTEDIEEEEDENETNDDEDLDETEPKAGSSRARGKKVPAKGKTPPKRAKPAPKTPIPVPGKGPVKRDFAPADGEEENELLYDAHVGAGFQAKFNHEPYFVQLNKHAIIPFRSTPGSCGFDLHSIEETFLSPGTTTVVKTGLGVFTPKGYYARIAARSGLSLHGLIVGAGVIDTDYRGEIGVVIHNVGKQGMKIVHGGRVAQLIFEKIFEGIPQVRLDFHDQTERQNNGFGSTGDL